jgi:glycosyltransferase involved in cell wall biosynthesis
VKITFVLSFVDETGGCRAVLRHAEGLRRRGHDVTVIHPFWPYRFGGGPRSFGGWRTWLGMLRRNLVRGRSIAFHENRETRVVMVPRIVERHVPDGDFVIATSHPTAHSVARLSRRKGQGIYLIQHYETDIGHAAHVEAAYRLPLLRFAGSEFTAEQLQRELGISVHGIGPNGVDAGYWSAGNGDATREGVLMMATFVPRKGLPDGLRALRAIRVSLPHAPIRVFGALPPDGLPVGTEFFRRPADDELRTLYQRTRVFLYTSLYEGFGLPPLEAMAAGCAVVTTRVGAIPEFSRDGIDTVWVEPGDSEAMAREVVGLLTDPARAGALSASAREQARRFDWDRATARFEQSLLAVRRD